MQQATCNSLTLITTAKERWQQEKKQQYRSIPVRMMLMKTTRCDDNVGENMCRVRTTIKFYCLLLLFIMVKVVWSFRLSLDAIHFVRTHTKNIFQVLCALACVFAYIYFHKFGHILEVLSINRNSNNNKRKSSNNH